MAEETIWSQLGSFFVGLEIAVLFFISTSYFLRGNRRDVRNDRIVLQGYSFFFLGQAVSRVFFYLSGILIGGQVTILSRIGNYVSDACFLLFFYDFERSILPTKYIFSKIQAIFVVWRYLALPDDMLLLVNVLQMLYGILVYIFILVYQTRHSNPEFQGISAIMLLATILYVIGVNLDYFGLGANYGIFYIIPPIFIIIACFILYSPFIIKPHLLVHPMKFWMILGGLSISSMFIYILVLSLILSVSDFLFVFPSLLILLIFLSVIYMVSIKFIRDSIKKEEKESQKSPQELLSVFSRAKKVSEEEISISKEKKTCLVCKGRISGMNFVCRSCEAFYCEKCYVALTNLENACWACESALDSTRPVNLKPMEEEEVFIPEPKKTLKS